MPSVSPEPPPGGIPSTYEQGGSAAGTGWEQPGWEIRRDEVWDEVWGEIWDAGTLATMNSASSGLSSCSFWAISAREMRE